MRSLALVESPAQLLNVLEWAYQAEVDFSRLTTVVLAPSSDVSRWQLGKMTELARAMGHTVRWHEPRDSAAATARTVRTLAVERHGVGRLVIGDPFSGVMQLVLTLSRATEVLIVDDGTATIEFARLLASGQKLIRWHSQSASAHRRYIAELARHRIEPGSGAALSLFTCMPVRLGGIPILRNNYSWVRNHFPTPAAKRNADLVGTSLVETGVVDLDHYLHGVRTLANNHSIDRYFAHRKESPAKLAKITELGLEVIRPDVPLEVVARRESMAGVIISFPSTVVHTLPVVLSDTNTQLLVCNIADDWYTRMAPTFSERFLGQVSTTARDAYGLLSVAC